MAQTEEQYVQSLLQQSDEEFQRGYDTYKKEARKLRAKDGRSNLPEAEYERLEVVNRYIFILKNHYDNLPRNIIEQCGPKDGPQTNDSLQANDQPQNSIIWSQKVLCQYVKKGMPIISDPRDILLRVTATTLIGSNPYTNNQVMVHMHDGDLISHELMGVIDRVGDQVFKLHVGQRVTVAFNIACGLCEYCKREEYSVCDATHSLKVEEKKLREQNNLTLFGYSSLKNGIFGGQAQYVRIPFADVNCLPIPNHIPDHIALCLSDVIPTAYHGCYTGNVKKGSIVAIWGLGPTGLLQVRWCQLLGAQRVIGIDYIPQRLEVAHQYLHIETINMKENQTTKKLLEMVPNGVDCSLQASGFNYRKSLFYRYEHSLPLTADVDVLTQMITCTRRSGTIFMTGDCTNGGIPIPIDLIIGKSLCIIGGQSHTQKYWNMCLDRVCSGEIDPTQVNQNDVRYGGVYGSFRYKYGYFSPVCSLY